ncbi:coiled-coil domain-containing protein 84 [Biomphalaria glabrata]|nr:coiled-coil domain-containing protein 84 [Biomphalaria glabrata]
MLSQKVFIQFRYCPLCRLNHKKGTKHVYAKRHQEIVTNILAKFLKKIVIAKSSMKNPSILESMSEMVNMTFWCYFCQSEITKHKEHFTAMGHCMIELGGMLEHFTRQDHVDNTVQFLRENKKDLVLTSDYIVSTEAYLKYLEVVDVSCSQFLKNKSDSLKLLAQEIKSQELQRFQVLTCAVQEQSQQHRKAPQLSPNPVAAHRKLLNAGNEVEQRRKTIQAFGDGLTPLDRTNEDDTLGNIYTNALPPWLMPDEEDVNSSGIIGPTLEDLEKHKKQEKKRQLPSCRVGAKFDHKNQTTDSWLPNFGGVWSHGRRTNSAQQFNRRQGKKVISLNQNVSLFTSDDLISPQAETHTRTHVSPSSLSLIPTSCLLQDSYNAQTLYNGLYATASVAQHESNDQINAHMLVQTENYSVTVKPYVRKQKLQSAEYKPASTDIFKPSHSSHSSLDYFHERQTSIKHNGNICEDPLITPSHHQFNTKPYQRHSKTVNSTEASTCNYNGLETFSLISTPILNRNKK